MKGTPGVKVEFTPSGKPVNHGYPGASYVNYGCRCDDCTEAHRANIARARERRKRKKIPKWVVHGKVTTYQNWGCRCDPCTKASNENRAKYRT